LNGRGITCPAECVLCGAAPEDSFHVLLTCSIAAQVWQASGLRNSVALAVQECDTAAEMIFHVLARLFQVQCSLFATILWSIWKCRNLRLWQQVTETAVQVYERATNMLDDWKHAQESRKNTADSAMHLDSRPRSVIQERWTKPAPGRFKCNVNASFSNELNIVGIGMCIRDAAGDYVLARTIRFTPLCVVEIGKALGLCEALQWVMELGLHNMDFSLDSKLVVDAVNRTARNYSDFGSVISHCRQLLNISLHNSKIEFSRRQANGVAHALA